jgi:hypothetical protein
MADLTADPLYPTCQQKNQQDDHQQPDSTGGSVAPIVAIGPSGQYPHQNQNQ